MPRNYSLDILRCLACVMVVLMHSPYPGDNAISWLNSGLSYITSPCIGLFFMISGSLLLGTKQDMATFIGKRLRKMALPTAVWSFIYLYIEGDGLIGGSLPRTMFYMIFNSCGSVLWFMYALVGLYLITPILAPWVQQASLKDLKIALGLWTLTLLFPILNSYQGINMGNHGAVYYIGGYVGYYVAGYAILNRGLRLPIKTMLALSTMSLALCTATSLYSLPISHDTFWYLGICTAIPTLTIFQLVAVDYSNQINSWLTNNQRNLTLLTNLSAATFGIYLIHILLMRHILWPMDWFASIPNYFLQSAISFVITFTVSYAITTVINNFRLTRLALSV